MSDSLSRRTNRTLALADHLWEALALMARDMGSDRETLVNQALFTFARLNGYVIPGRPSEGGASPPPPRLHEAPRPTEQVPLDAGRGRSESGSSLPMASTAALPFPSELASARAGERNARASVTAPKAHSDSAVLYVVIRNAEPVPVTLARFLIGRGMHCDLVIDSNRVSREHAVIFREDNEVIIEDLSSSNGTWLQKQRVTRRAIQEGDEFLLGNEKLTCQFHEP